jgi:hypothetical protein
MKQLNGKYGEIEFVKSDSAQEKNNLGPERGVKLNPGEWDETVQRLAVMFRSTNDGTAQAAALSDAVAAGMPGSCAAYGVSSSPAKPLLITQIKTGVLSP